MYLHEGHTIEFTAPSDIVGDQVVQLGKLILICPVGCSKGTFTAGARTGVHTQPTTLGMTAAVGDPARYDIAAQKLVATGGIVIGVYTRPVAATDAGGTFVLVPTVPAT